ncbi:MAG: FtsX-like permease family protein, partial [Spongiibacteraceae bacterium]|jgi:lipoprotein-releasing system permease protein|nr:FtsX-like permease family protein [Spongiibacteraceae bacterium]
VQTLLDLPGGVTQIDLAIDKIFEASRVSERLTRLTGLEAESWMEKNRELLNALESQTLSTQIVRLFVAISVAFGIASVMAVSVVQRTREIGILRAMGSPRQQILRIFLLQGGLVGLTGSSIGGAIGLGLVVVFNEFGPGLFYIPLDFSLLPSAVAIATLTGILSAALPARRGATYDPAVAIRYV